MCEGVAMRGVVSSAACNRLGSLAALNGESDATEETLELFR